MYVRADESLYRGSVGCRGGSGTVHVGQWRRSTMCTRQSNSGPNTVLYIDQPPLKMGNANINCQTFSRLRYSTYSTVLLCSCSSVLYKAASRSRINEQTISLRFLGIIVRALRLEVSVQNVSITKQFQITFARGGGGGIPSPIASKNSASMPEDSKNRINNACKFV